MCSLHFIPLLLFSTGVSLSTPSPLLTDAEDLWAAADFTGSTRVLENMLASDRGNSEALWRIARNYYDIGENLPAAQKDERFALYVRVEEFGRKCIKADPADGNCYFWTGVGIGRQGTVRGLVTQVRRTKEMRTLWLKALSLQRPYRSREGTSSVPGDYYLALGILYRLTPEWIMTQALVGFRGSIDTSIEYLRTALSLEPERMEYLKELGVSLICRGTRKDRPEDIEEGNAFLLRTQTLPILKVHDRIDREHAPVILAHPEMACGYSRDGQQEISEKEALKSLRTRPPAE